MTPIQRNNIVEGMICSLFTSISGQNFCPICGTMAKFTSYGNNNDRPKALCPNCNSLERHRCISLDVNSCLSLNCRILYVGSDIVSEKICNVTSKYESYSVKKTADLNNAIEKMREKDIVILDNIINHCSSPLELLKQISNNVSKGTYIIIGLYTYGSTPKENGKIEYVDNSISINDLLISTMLENTNLSLDYSKGYSSLSKEQINTYSLNAGYRTYVLIKE